MKIGVLDILGIVFVTLKLTDYIDWSWWYVVMPFYIVPALIVGFLLLFFIIVSSIGFVIVVCELFKELLKKKGNK